MAIKSKIVHREKRTNDPTNVIKSLIPCVDDDDYHDFEYNVPVLSRTKDGLSVVHTHDWECAC